MVALAASAHTTGNAAERNPDGDLAAIVVVGKRASLATARDIKREKLEVVDSVVSEEIGKLPDFSVTDAIQRVTGVQVARDRGDGANVAIRGLTQIETTINGREVFTAGNGRVLDLADVPAEMLAGIDVYKTSSAHQIEGGIGGLVDLRMRRPFDFSGPQATATVRSVDEDLAKSTKTQYSMLLSNRWKGGDAGEFGALVGLALQDRGFREDQKSAGNPIVRSIGGQTVVAPNGTVETTSIGTRKRSGVNFALQWRPSSELDLYAEGSHTELRTVQNSYQFIASAGATAAGMTTFPGTSDVQAIAWNNAAVTTAGAARDTTDRNSQLAIGGTWNRRNLTVTADLSYTRSHNDLLYSAFILTGTTNLAQNLADTVPASSASGGNLLSLSSYTNAGMWYASRPFDGDLKAARIDAELRIAGNFLDTVSTGLRVARRHATDAPGQVSLYPDNVAAANAAGYVGNNPYANFFPGASSVQGYLTGDPALARNPNALRQALGIAAAIPSGNPLGTWDIAEETDSAYAMATIRAADFPLDGNAGIRVVRTRESVAGYQTVPAGGVAPIAIDSKYVDILPSVNARYEVAHDLFLRASASKTLTRPDFNQMSPSLTLNVVQRNGTAGNPALRPVRADNADVGIERYFGKSSSAHLAVFAKKVDGFLVTVSAPETYGGSTYQVSRPQNANTATIAGVETGYQQFYDFLPGWLSGFGLQANYTYVDSKALDNTLGQKMPLQNLSKHSLNLIALYERGRISARAAYNWRDKFISAVGSYGGIGAVPIYTRAYGWLDASFTYRYSAKLAFSIEGNNLLRTVRRSYYGVETRPKDAWINDRQLVLAATVKF